MALAKSLNSLPHLWILEAITEWDDNDRDKYEWGDEAGPRSYGSKFGWNTPSSTNSDYHRTGILI